MDFFGYFPRARTALVSRRLHHGNAALHSRRGFNVGAPAGAECAVATASSAVDLCGPAGGVFDSYWRTLPRRSDCRRAVYVCGAMARAPVAELRRKTQAGSNNSRKLNVTPIT